jgi:hypothetical protein
MANQNIPRVNGRVLANAHMTSSYYSKNGLGKLTDKNFVETMLRTKPEQYDKMMLRLFTDTRLYSNDLLDLVMKSGKPFQVNDPNGIFTYKIKKRAELPKVVKAQGIGGGSLPASPGIDGSTFEIIFDKQAFVTNDIISAHRYEQETLVQVVAEPVRHQNGFLYTVRAAGANSSDFVASSFLSVGVEYFKVGNVLGEYSTSFSSLGLFDGNLEVMADVLSQYGVEHTITDWADATKLGMQTDASGNPLDITYYSVTDPNAQGEKTKIVGWEPTVSRLLRMEMMRMKANMLMWGRQGNTVDEKGRPTRLKSGLWQQLHLGNVIHYDKGQFSLNLLRTAIGDLFYNRVKFADRSVKVYTNRSGMELASTAIRKDFNGQNFTVQADKFMDGKDRLKQGYALQFDHFLTTETGPVEFVELEQLNMHATFLELGPNKKTPPIFIILDVSGQEGAGIREVKLSTRPNMQYHYIPGTTGFGQSQTVVASKDPYSTYVMKDYSGIFLEDPTKTVIIKEFPRL